MKLSTQILELSIKNKLLIRHGSRISTNPNFIPILTSNVKIHGPIHGIIQAVNAYCYTISDIEKSLIVISLYYGLQQMNDTFSIMLKECRSELNHYVALEMKKVKLDKFSDVSTYLQNIKEYT